VEEHPGTVRQAPPTRSTEAVFAETNWYHALASLAADELRSTNAQIEFLLRRALAQAGRLPSQAREMRGPGRPRADS
jgi:hypothetical protein